MNKNQGFTLIELLVVVLIIGILSSVALPQYTKAVAKARVTEAITALRSITDAQEVYYLANMSFASNLEDLDIEITNPGRHYRYQCGTRTCFAYPLRAEDPTIEFHMNQMVSSARPEYLGKHWCVTTADTSAKTREVCRSLGPEDPDKPGYYLIQ